LLGLRSWLLALSGRLLALISWLLILSRHANHKQRYTE
jgi:hypothetical protein